MKKLNTVELLNLPNIVYRTMQFVGVIPFRIKNAKVEQSRVLVIQVIVTCLIFELLFYQNAYKAYLYKSTILSLHNFVSYSRCFVSVLVFCVTVLCNIWRRKKHEKFLYTIHETIKYLRILGITWNETQLALRMLKLFLVFVVYDLFLNAPVLIYTNTFEFMLWPTLFWSCFVAQNFCTNLMILYLHHLAKCISTQVNLLITKLENEECFTEREVFYVFVCQKNFTQSIKTFNSGFGLVILLNVLYDFVFVVSQAYLTLFYILGTVEFNRRFLLVCLRMFLFIFPACVKLFTITTSMESLKRKVSSNFGYKTIPF